MKLLRLLALFLLLAPSPAAAQSTALTGRVTDRATGRPLADVNVFLAGTTRGAATDSTGHFRIEAVPAGHYRLYASRVGYARAMRDTLLRADRTYTVRLRLKPTVVELAEVTVASERDEEWAEQLEAFERHFLGTSARADSARLLNPEVLSFESTWWGKLTAEATRPLVIENQMLGYRLRYFLKEFTASGGTVKWDGEPLFEELTPADSAQATRWRRNRRAAYRGSLRHFLRALLAGRTRQEGFRMWRLWESAGRMSPTPFRVDADDVLEDDSTQHYLDFHGRLRITYLREPAPQAFLHSPYRLEDNQTSYIELNDGPVTIDPTGEIVEPYGATLYGYFAFTRVADLLPKHYQPK